MKPAKLLKSVFLSTALLWGGATQAQTTDTGSASLIIATPPVTISASDMSFGSWAVGGTRRTEVYQDCPVSGETTTSSVIGDVYRKLTDGSCGVVSVTNSSATPFNYLIKIISAPLTSPGLPDIPAPDVRLYETFTGTTQVRSGSPQTLSGNSRADYYVGGSLRISGNRAAGTFTGDYTIEVTVR